MELPAGPSTAGTSRDVRLSSPAANFLSFTLVYRDADGEEVRLQQQAAGLGSGIFPAYAECEVGRWPAPGSCLAWFNRGTYLLLSSTAAHPRLLASVRDTIDTQ